MDRPHTRAPVAEARKRLWRFLALLFVLLVTLIVAWARPRPGRTTLTYRIGPVDERFGLSREEVAEAIRNAVAIWRAPVGRRLFREDPRGEIEISLVYDHRQAALDQLRTLNQGFHQTQGVLEGMKVDYTILKADYEQRRDTLREDFIAYDQRVAAFNVEAQRQQGDGTDSEARRQRAERDQLTATLAALRRRETELEESRLPLASRIEALNQVLAGQRAQADTYQKTGELLGEDFEEGVYVRRHGHQSITIYSFASPKVLVRVLAHELGHALGLQHARDPGAIMYPRVQSDSWDLAPEDLAAIKAKCGR